jgi:hypothetical protein
MKKPTVFFLLVCLLIAKSSFTQVDSIGLKTAMQQLDKALLEKNESVLKQLMNKNLSFGHSNGWIQKKEDVLADFKSGKLTYNKIENSNVAILDISKKWATVKTVTHAEGVVNGNAFNLGLHVMQVWVSTKKGWQLYARQSAKQ